MTKGLDALEELRQNNKDNSHLFDDELLNTIEKELKTLEILKDICLEGKDKYGTGTWGWVEFNLDEEPELKEWLKGE